MGHMSTRLEVVIGKNRGLLGGLILLLYCVLVLPLGLWCGGLGVRFVIEWEAFRGGGACFSFPIMLDCISLGFSFVVCYIRSMVMFYSISYMEGDCFFDRFIWLVGGFVFSINMLLFVPRLAGVILGWDGLGITSFALIIYYQRAKSLRAGILTALINRVGDVFIVLSICFVFFCGQWSLCYL